MLLPEDDVRHVHTYDDVCHDTYMMIMMVSYGVMSHHAM